MPVKAATSSAFLLKTALPVLTAALLAVAVATAFVFWSTSETDRVAITRQERLVHVIVDQLRSGVAHDQESVTVWDDSVRAVQAQNLEWIDVNLGSWMQSYFGHDGAFVLTADRVPSPQTKRQRTVVSWDDGQLLPSALSTIEESSTSGSDGKRCCSGNRPSPSGACSSSVAEPRL